MVRVFRPFYFGVLAELDFGASITNGACEISFWRRLDDRCVLEFNYSDVHPVFIQDLTRWWCAFLDALVIYLLSRSPYWRSKCYRFWRWGLQKYYFSNTVRFGLYRSYIILRQFPVDLVWWLNRSLISILWFSGVSVYCNSWIRIYVSHIVLVVRSSTDLLNTISVRSLYYRVPELSLGVERSRHFWGL